jgi:hypothetical protein
MSAPPPPFRRAHWGRSHRAVSGRNALSPEKRHIHIFMPAPKIGSGESRFRSPSARVTANRISYRIPEISVEIGVTSMASSRNKVEALRRSNTCELHRPPTLPPTRSLKSASASRSSATPPVASLRSVATHAPPIPAPHRPAAGVSRFRGGGDLPAPVPVLAAVGGATICATSATVRQDRLRSRLVIVCPISTARLKQGR